MVATAVTLTQRFVAVAIGFGIGTAIWVLGIAWQMDSKDEADFRAWLQWRTEHCQIVAVSSGGIRNGSDMVAVRCDDGKDYVQYGRWRPSTWEPR